MGGRGYGGWKMVGGYGGAEGWGIGCGMEVLRGGEWGCGMVVLGGFWRWNNQRTISGQSAHAQRTISNQGTLSAQSAD